MQCSHDLYTISDDPARVDRDRVWRWLHDDSYWAKGRSRAVFDRAFDHSLVLGAYAPDGAQAAFARVVTDHATFAWLCDVVVLPEHRGRGLGKGLVAAAVGMPELGGVRRILLATADAHDLYARSGFVPLSNPERWMERSSPSRLFVYGTLMPGRQRWPHLERFAVGRRPGEISGALYDTGRGWPAVVVGDAGAGVVPGVVVDLDPATVAEALALIDEVESTADGLFQRALATTVGGDQVWTYVYGNSVSGFRRIDRWEPEAR